MTHALQEMHWLKRMLSYLLPDYQTQTLFHIKNAAAVKIRTKHSKTKRSRNIWIYDPITSNTSNNKTGYASDTYVLSPTPTTILATSLLPGLHFKQVALNSTRPKPVLPALSLKYQSLFLFHIFFTLPRNPLSFLFSTDPDAPPMNHAHNSSSVLSFVPGPTV